MAAGAEASGKPIRRVEEPGRQQVSWNYASPAEILIDIAASVPAYKGMSYAALQGTGGQWGRQENENYYFDGTSYENTGGLGVQLPAAVALSEAVQALQPFKIDQRPQSASERPFTLVPATFLYDDSALLTSADLLNNRRARAVAALNPADSRALGVTNGDLVTITSGWGSLTLPVQTTNLAPQGAVIVPLGVKSAPLAQIVEGPLTAVSVRRAEG